MNRTELKFKVLLVEDNPGDIRLTQEVLKSSKLINQMHVVVDGEEAVKYLRKEPGYEKAMTPDLIILDLNIPRLNGIEVLEVIKTDSDLCHIPVVVFTSSDAMTDISKSYLARANCYLVKPTEFSALLKTMKALEEFWFTVAKLPVS